jgi:hypothetical protein
MGQYVRKETRSKQNLGKCFAALQGYENRHTIKTLITILFVVHTYWTCKIL